MDQVFLLGVNERFSPKVTKWLYLLISVCFLANGVINIYSQFSAGNRSFMFFLTPVMLLGAAFYIFMFAAAFSAHSRFAPKVRLTDTAIQFKKDVFGSLHQVMWLEVKTIELHPYKIIFEGSHSIHSISYHTTPEVSLQVKQAIRNAAGKKGIPVYGG